MQTEGAILVRVRLCIVEGDILFQYEIFCSDTESPGGETLSQLRETLFRRKLHIVTPA